MKINQLNALRNVKIYLAKIKDCKGKEDRAYKQDFFANKNKAKKTAFGDFMHQKLVSSHPRFLQNHLKVSTLAIVNRPTMKPTPQTPLRYSRKEVTGAITLLFLVLLLYTGAQFVSYIIPPSPATIPPDHPWLLAAAHLPQHNTSPDSLTAAHKNNLFTQSTTNSYLTPATRTLFYFNPNELTAEGWEQLGIRGKTITTIINYRNKGGKFYQPEDLKKIYGLSSTDYAAIVPYVRIPSTITKTATQASAPAAPAPAVNNSSPIFPKKTYHTIDINLADTDAYSSLPGIGTTLANRIINFRDKLGGFYRVEQLAETYGIQDTTFQKLMPYLQLNPVAIKKININTAAIEMLSAHPYIRGTVAKTIIAYRQQHGLFKNIDDVKKIMSINDSSFEKIKHYIKVD